MDIHNSWIWYVPMDIKLCIFNKWITRHGYRMGIFQPSEQTCFFFSFFFLKARDSEQL